MIESLGWIATICFATCYYPQLYKTWRRKKVADISVWPWLIQAIGYCTGVGYGIGLHQWPLICGYFHGFICTSIFLVMYYRYRGIK